jgi:hypothetical protein
MIHALHLLLSLHLLAVPGAAFGDSLDSLLVCNATALGGEPALERIENLRIVLDIHEPTFEVTGTYVASREGYMRIDIEAGGQRVFAEGLNGDGAWQWTPEGGFSTSRPEGAAALRQGIESPGRFWTLRQLQQRGLAIEWLQPGPLARPGEWQLRLTRADGSAFDYFLDREACLPTRELSQRAFHPDVDATEVPVETVFSEPERVGEVLRFRHSESRRLDTGEWLGTTVLRSAEQNVKLAKDFFEAR